MTDPEIENEAGRTARRLAAQLLPGHRAGMRSITYDEFTSRDGAVTVCIEVTIKNHRPERSREG